MMARIRPALALIALGLSSLAAAQGSDEAALIIDAMIENLRAESVRATVVMTVTDGDKVVERVLEILSVGDDRSLVTVVAPPRDAGQAFLNVGQNLFIYSPRLRRTLRLPPSGRSDNFLDSDLSFNDLAGDDYRQDYTATVVERDNYGLTLELTPDPQAPTPYGKLLYSADATTFAPTLLVFFDQRGQAVREIRFSNVIEVDGRHIPTRFEVHDLLSEGSSTVAVWQDYDFDAEISESCFNQQALERGCR
jgi:outer membrane lipoprotein-sorting protein